MAEVVAIVATISQDPVKVASQLIPAYEALRRATEAAEHCEDISRAMIRKACHQSPILCKLLKVGQICPEDHDDLNSALFRCLADAVVELQGACDAMYEYMQHNTVGRLM
jgi:hypothetical protein